MKTVRVNKECIMFLENKNIDYKLTEILGLVDYSVSSKLECMPIADLGNKCDVNINDDTYDAICANFKKNKDADSIVEALLWMYGLVGKNI